MHAYSALTETLSPKLIGKLVTVTYINNENVRIEGCLDKKFRGDKSKKGFKREFNVMVVNLAYVDPEDVEHTYTLLLHELAHDTVQSNDHPHADFYYTVETLAGRLAALMLDEPRSFDIGANNFILPDVQPQWGPTPEVHSEGSLITLRNKAASG